MAKKEQERKQTPMEEIHEKLGTKNAKGILEAVDNQQAAIAKLAQSQPIVLTLVINTVTGAPTVTNSPLQNPKEDLKLLLVALRKVEDNVTQSLFALVEGDADGSSKEEGDTKEKESEDEEETA